MSSEIKCPKCGNAFAPGDAIREEVEKETRAKVAEWQKKKTEEFQVKLEEEKKQLRESLVVAAKQSVAQEYEQQLKVLEQANTENEQKLKEARQQQLDYLQKERALKNKEQELEITLQKKLQEERDALAVEIRKIEEQKMAGKEVEFQLKLKEMEEKLDTQRKLAEEMKRFPLRSHRRGR